jgi:hypothetical protein
MNWKVLCLLAILLIGFSFPLASGIRLPKDYSAEELGNFLGQIIAYWRDVFSQIIQKIGLNFSVSEGEFYG